MSEKMFDAYNQEIVLTNEQEACLKYTGERTLMVKGYAGAGKSIVLMAIAKRYLEEYGHNKKNMVAVFTFQRTLVSTTKETLSVNDEPDEAIIVSTVNSYLKAIYDDLVKKGKLHKLKFLNQNDPKRRVNVEAAINKHKSIKGAKHRFHDFDYDFWLDEFDWMKDMNIGADDLDAYIQYKRKGRGSSKRFSGAEYLEAFQLYTFYLAQLNKVSQGDWADIPMILIRNSELIPEEFKIRHILVDEAQDLSLAQMTALMCLFSTGGDMIIAMDANQKIHSKYWTPQMLGIQTHTKKLTKSMRTTLQIDNLAEAVRRKNDENLDEDDMSIRALPEKSGPLPTLVHLDNPAAEQEYVVNLVRTYLETNPNITIGVIAAKKKDLVDYSEWFTSANIMFEQITSDSTFSMNRPGVKVASAFGAKGLEFTVVVIPRFMEGHFPYSYSPKDEEEKRLYMVKMRNLVYVSMTRAKQVLFITWFGDKGSRFIADMDSDLYIAEGSKFIIKKPLDFIWSNGQNGHRNRAESNRSDEEYKKPFAVLPPKEEKDDKTKDPTQKTSLKDYLMLKGIEVIDKRSQGGALWAVGGKELDSLLKETTSLYGAKWGFSQSGGSATKKRPGWFTKSSK